MKRVKGLLALLLVCISLVLPSVAKANLLCNGGFEFGSFACWTRTGDLSFTSVTAFGFGPEEGTRSALLGPRSLGFLSQTFIDNPGDTLQVSFYYQSNGGAGAVFEADFNGNPMTAINAVIPTSVWTQVIFTATATGSDILRFDYLSASGFIGLDGVDITVVATHQDPPPDGGGSPIPEPARAPTLLFFGTSALFLLYKKRRTSFSH